MTATDELRRLLDERGVEYVLDEEYGEKYPPEKRVTWSCDLAGEDMTVTARDYCININDDGSADYCLDLEFHEVFTVEQAIDATLGDVPCLPYFWTHDGTLHIELPRLPESISVRLPDQRDREVRSARVWQYTQGSGTCHMEYCDEWSGDELYPTEAYVCSACGYITVDGKPNHCPNCGRKAVDE